MRYFFEGHGHGYGYGGYHSVGRGYGDGELYGNGNGSSEVPILYKQDYIDSGDKSISGSGSKQYPFILIQYWKEK